MAFRSTLNLGGKEYDVLDCSYSLKRDVDSKGRPSSNIYGDRISVRVESTEVTISAQIIKIGGAEYEENWPKA